MNDERLKELARQANFTPQCFDILNPGLGHFAELIVRECSDICTDPYRTQDGWGITGADQRCSDLIKKHFGIE